MARYIDADIATYLMIQWADRETNEDIRHGYHNCLVIMNDMPTADVKPVVRGEWYDKGSLSCRCSNCGCKNNKETNYCSNCGAEMRGDKNENQ